MEITKTVPVTIKVRKGGIFCASKCRFNKGKFEGKCDLFDTKLETGGRWWDAVRCPACLAEFGTGEKENEK